MGLSSEVGGNRLDGLSQLRALMASGRKPGILVALDFEFVEVEASRAVFAGTPGQHAYNPIGTVHGGNAATLLDSACGCAVHSRLMASQAYTTLELKVAYHSRSPRTLDSCAPRAASFPSGGGRRLPRTKLTDTNGNLYASATSSLFVFDR